MYRQFSKDLESKIKVCLQCGKEFIPLHHGGTKEYCSQRCACISNLKLRKEIPKKTIIKKCNQCGNDYKKSTKGSISQWSMNKFCSRKCSGENKKIKDGLTNNERHRRKTGATKMHSPEWLEKIKATTKEGMLKPEVKEKITKPRAPMSEEGKIIRSDALAGMLPKNLTFGNGSFSNVQRGEYECSKGSVYFRSKWEANYALYLDFLIKNNEILNWEYEADVFFFEKIKLGTRSYRPDFKIFNSDGSIEYHEVKGYMDSRSKTKLKRMGIYFPDVELVLIDSVFYRSLYKNFKKLLKFY